MTYKQKIFLVILEKKICTIDDIINSFPKIKRLSLLRTVFLLLKEKNICSKRFENKRFFYIKIKK